MIKTRALGVAGSIARRFAVVFPALAILPIFFISFFAYQHSRQLLEKNIGLGLQRQASQVMSQVDQMLSERLRDVEAWVSEPMFQELSSNDSQELIHLFLSKIKKQSGFYSEILCVNPQGEIVADTRNRFKGTNVAAEPWFRKTLESSLGTVEDLALRPTFGGYSILIAVPIVPDGTEAAAGQGNSSALGIVVAIYNWSEVMELVNGLPIMGSQEQSQSSYALLINRSGDVLTQPFFEERELIIAANLVRDHLRSATLAVHGKEGYWIEKGLYQDLNLIGFAPSRGYRDFKGLSWGALVFQNAKKAFEPILELQWRIILVAVIAFFVILAASIFLARGVTRPLKILTHTATQIAKVKDLSQRVHLSSHDELGQLADAFNQMISDLDQANQEKERAEKVILQSEKMAAVGQLAGGVAHEINNPLGVILGFSQSITKRLHPGDPLEMPLKSIEREALRCKSLVQDLLAFSRMGKTEKEEIDLNQAIDSSLSLILARAKLKNTQLVKEFDPLLPKIRANQNQLQQIIVNLSNNAMDAIPPQGGTLTFRTKKASLDGKDAVEIQVQDTGGGIPKDIQSKIFEPFFTTKGVGKGTGLGLSLVYEIIQKHQGKIMVESETGKGTLFRMFLPFSQR